MEADPEARPHRMLDVLARVSPSGDDVDDRDAPERRRRRRRGEQEAPVRRRRQVAGHSTQTGRVR